MLDGHPHTLSFLAAIRGAPIACLGVSDFGQSGDVDDLYRYFGIDADTIVGAAHRPARGAPVTEITMPRLSDSMEEGTILKWLKSDGDDVAAGEDLVEIETDKATMTYAAEHEGTLEIVAAEGSSHSVGEVIARVGVASERPSATERNGHDARRSRARAPSHRRVETPAVATPSARRDGDRRRRHRPATRHRRPRRWPGASRRSTGSTWRAWTGTGPRGRITRADVLAAAGVQRPSTVPAAPAAPRAASDRSGAAPRPGPEARPRSRPRPASSR